MHGTQPTAATAQAVITGEPGINAQGHTAPGTTGHHQRGSLAAGAGCEHLGPSGRHRRPPETEYHQIQTIEQYSGDLHGIGHHASRPR
jgi:hypothetical protein